MSGDTVSDECSIDVNHVTNVWLDGRTRVQRVIDNLDIGSRAADG